MKAPESSSSLTHGFCRLLPPLIMRGLNLKISQNFMGTKFAGGINLYDGS